MKSRKTKKDYSTLAIIVVGATIGSVFGMRPWHYFMEQRAIAAEATARAVESERKTEADEELDAHIGSSIGREELARQSGWRLPGEIPVPSKNE